MALCGTSSPLLAAHWVHAVNGTVLAATIFWTCIKIAKVLKDFHTGGAD